MTQTYPTEPGVHPSRLPWQFPGKFFLLTYHGSHSRLIFRSIADMTQGGTDDELDDNAWDAVPTVDVMFVGVKTLRVDVAMQDIVVREAEAWEADSNGVQLCDGARLFLVEAARGGGWALADGVWWTRSEIPYNDPSPLLADLDFSKSDFSWEATGTVLYVA